MTTTTKAPARLAAPPTIPITDDGAVRQGALTVVTRIRPGSVESLRTLLQSIDRDPAAGTDVESNPHIPFLELSRIHFARFVIFDEATDVRGRTIPATLVFSSNYDGPLDAHLIELIARAGPGVDRIYGHCEGYPSAGHDAPDAVIEYLKRNRLSVNTFYVGTAGKPVGQIRREANLREAIGEYLDALPRTEQPPRPAELRKQIAEFVARTPSLAWALTPPKRYWPQVPGGAFGIATAAAAVLALLFVLIRFPRTTLMTFGASIGAVLVSVALWLLLLRMKEKQDDRTAWTDKNRPRKPELVSREDRVVQNQLSSVINIKPGFMRAVTLRTVLTAINAAARFVFYKGKLGGIPSIHFARWVIVDEGRRLAFFSNFDGSWESYLGEFVDHAATGLTGVWSNCVNFPPTRWLLYDGARNEQEFKSYARDGQVVTQVWYSAYKTLTMLNITNNTEIRKGLTGDMNEAELANWLRRL